MFWNQNSEAVLSSTISIQNHECPQKAKHAYTDIQFSLNFPPFIIEQGRCKDDTWNNEHCSLLPEAMRFLHFKDVSDSEGVLFKCQDETASEFLFQNTCGIVKSDLQNIFELEIAMGHFFGAPCSYAQFNLST